MKILSASVKVIDDKNHIKVLGLSDVNITIKGKTENPIAHIPEIKEENTTKKPTKKKWMRKKPKKE